MMLDRRQTKWAVAAAVAAVGSLVVYVAYVVLSPNGARAGSLMGLFFASLGTGVIVFECLLGLRKKYPASPLGRVKTWLSAHVWLGMLSFLLILMHAGFRWGHGLAAVLMSLFAVIVASGIFGVALQNYIPRRMTELVARETIFESNLSRPTGFAPDLGARERVAAVVSRPVLHILDERFRRARGGQNLVHNFEIGQRATPADIVDLAFTAFPQDGADGAAVIVHVQPVAHLQAVAIHRQGPALERIRDHER